MAAEEASLHQALSRRQRSEQVVDHLARHAAVRQKMCKRYASEVLDRYFACSTRRQHAGLQSFLPHEDTNVPAPHSAVLPSPPTAPSDASWPQNVPDHVLQARIREYRAEITLKVESTCSVCARRSFSKDLLFLNKSVSCRRVDARLLDLQHLRITDAFILAKHKHHFNFGHDLIDGLALDRAGIHIDEWDVQLDVCDECRTCLTGKDTKTPALSLANGNIRGFLPPNLQDVTWLEERLCAKYLGSAYVVRLYDVTSPGAPPERPRIMKGHACSFPLNVISTATKLPWTFSDGGPLLSCIVIGPRAPRLDDLRNVFTVRRAVVRNLLLFLRDNFDGYPQFDIDDQALQQLPESGVPELLMRGLLYQDCGDVPSLFDLETSGLEQHPALGGADELETGMTFLEHHGMIDINGVTVPAHERTAAALSHATGGHRPDLLIRHGSSFINQYSNPGLFPGMYPTLFPWGTGGFEQKRGERLSFSRHAAHLLDLADDSFRRHWSYVFMVANIKQRRQIHLGTRLVCNSRDFDQVSKELRNLDVGVIERVQAQLSQTSFLKDATDEERRVLKLLKKCELVSVRVPGSKAAMNKARADIRGYIGQFGVFHLFLTMNPTPAHSPVFQVFYGDASVCLDTRAPDMPNSSTRAVRVADDPVAAADYFHFHIYAVFKFLFGWDCRSRQSTVDGGLFGRIKAFYLVKEHTMRGQLHGHILIWLEGGLNPRQLRERMKDDDEFRNRYLAFFDDIIRHHTPASPTPPSPDRKPRQEMPPSPGDANFSRTFDEDHRILAEAVQRHRCTKTCFKGGRTSCRFLFPHQVNEEPYFNAEESSINPRILDPMMNWHNAALLVATRHNHDLKCVQSGKSGVAAASYITSYATKSDETPVNQVSMIRTVFDRMVKLGQDTSVISGLLSRCVMQFGRERQVHAQQAATYVRNLGDTWESHHTIPMLSGRMYFHVLTKFGPLRDGGSASTTGLSRGASGPSAGNTNNSGSETTIHEAEHSDEDDPGDLIVVSNATDAHQVDDYLRRGPTLDSLSFYEFVRTCTLVNKPKRPNKAHHSLSASHPNSDSKCHRYTPSKPRGVPRPIFSSLPRSNGTPTHGDAYCALMLAHFKPFSVRTPIKNPDESYEQAFESEEFSSDAQRVMQNWSALTECDDTRDAEQLLRRKREAHRDHGHDEATQAIANAQHEPVDDATADLDIETLMHIKAKKTAETLAYIDTLGSAHWFDVNRETALDRSHPSRTASTCANSCTPRFTKPRMKEWTKQIADLEAEVNARMTAPRASTGILAESLGVFAPSTNVVGTEDFPDTTERSFSSSTIRFHWTNAAPDAIITSLIAERQLSPSQALAFTIAARHFFSGLADHCQQPLRLFMHGEAGTGKTVVVRLLRELLEAHGKGKEILFMAPTGKAAYAIGGTTQHATFAIEVLRRGKTSEELVAGPRDSFSAKRTRYLQKTFANVQWLFFDEVSMTSCEIIAEIDQSLRVARQEFDLPFGGMNVIFAGDLCQLPPVGAAALYAHGSLASKTGETRTKVELGRIVWQQINEVVNFTEQRRMQDVDMAAALSRLRLRRCTKEDVALFNTNVLRSANNPAGVTLNGRPDAIVLCRTNETVRALNHQKATAVAESANTNLVMCAADDRTTAPMTPEQRNALLSYNGTTQFRIGLGRIPLYVGMPIVYRGPNQSVPLGITNGSFGTVEGWSVRPDRFGNLVAEGVVVRFHQELTFKLTDLNAGCLPILPTKHTFKFNSTTAERTVTDVKRVQLPIQPGFAMTVHSAQGITSEGPVIVDLRKGGFDAYVAASRATRKDNLLLLGTVTLRHLNYPPLPLALQAEMKRLNRLADDTIARHQGAERRLGTKSNMGTTSATILAANDSRKRSWQEAFGAHTHDGALS